MNEREGLLRVKVNKRSKKQVILSPCFRIENEDENSMSSSFSTRGYHDQSFSHRSSEKPEALLLEEEKEIGAKSKKQECKSKQPSKDNKEACDLFSPLTLSSRKDLVKF